MKNSLVITLLACSAYTMCSLEKTSLYPVTLTCLPTDMLRLISHQIGVTSNVTDAQKHFAVLATSCKTLNTFLKKEKQECLKRLFLAVQRDNDVQVKNLTNHLVRMMPVENIVFSADKDGNTLVHYVAINSNQNFKKKFKRSASGRILLYLDALYHTYKVSRAEKIKEAIKKNDIASLKQHLTKTHPDSGIRLNMIPNKKGQRPSKLTVKARSYLTYFHPLKFFSKSICQEVRYINYAARRFGGRYSTFPCRCKPSERLPKINLITPLMFACYKKNTEAVKQLLIAGANPNVQSDTSAYGFPPLSTCLMMTSDVAIQKMLLEHGAQPNLTNIYNETALIQAIKQQKIPSIKLLLGAGSDVNVYSLPHNSYFRSLGRTALEYFWGEVEYPSNEKEWEVLKLLARKIIPRTPFERAILNQNQNKINTIITKTALVIKMIESHGGYVKKAKDSVHLRKFLDEVQNIKKLEGKKLSSKIQQLEQLNNKIYELFSDLDLRFLLKNILYIEKRLHDCKGKKERKGLLNHKKDYLERVKNFLKVTVVVEKNLAHIDELFKLNLFAPNLLHGDGPLLNYLFKNAEYFETEKLLGYVDRLINLGANLFLKSKGSKSPIANIMGIKGQKGLSLLKLVLDKKKNIGLVPSGWGLNFDLKRAQLLLEHGADPNTQDASGYTALKWALMAKTLKEKKQWFVLFDEYGADFNIKSKSGMSIIDYVQEIAKNTKDYRLLDFLKKLLASKNRDTKK